GRNAGDHGVGERRAPVLTLGSGCGPRCRQACLGADFALWNILAAVRAQYNGATGSGPGPANLALRGAPRPRTSNGTSPRVAARPLLGRARRIVRATHETFLRLSTRRHYGCAEILW